MDKILKFSFFFIFMCKIIFRILEYSNNINIMKTYLKKVFLQYAAINCNRDFGSEYMF